MCGGKGHWDCVICGATGFIKKEIEGSSVRGRRIRKKCVACVGRGKRLCKKCGATGIKAI